MKLYGIGTLTAPGTERVVHDFVDGPFETANPVLIEAALRQGCRQEPFEVPAPAPKTAKPKVAPAKPKFNVPEESK